MRQLESMIRLSEAMAKLSCSDTVEPKHVREAFRLLNKSIIRVETPDIDFDEHDEDIEADDQKGVINGVNGEQGEAEVPEKEAVEKPKVRVTYEEYKTVANLLILYLRQLEESGTGMYVPLYS